MSCNLPSKVSLVNYASDEGKRPCAVIWPFISKKNSSKCFSPTCTRPASCYSSVCRKTVSEKYTSIQPKPFVFILPNATATAYIEPNDASERVGTILSYEQVFVVGTKGRWLHVVSRPEWVGCRRAWVPMVSLNSPNHPVVFVPTSKASSKWYT